MFTQFASLLCEISKTHQTLLRSKQLHALIIKTHLSNDPFYATNLIRFYESNNDLLSAQNLFEKTPHRSVYLWNSIIRAHARARKFHFALSLFKDMLWSKIKPDNFTFACVLRTCSESCDFKCLRLVHGGLVVRGFGTDSVCSSALVSAYSKLGFIDEASKVFDGVLEPDLVLWNSMISGFGSSGLWDRGWDMFNMMRRFGQCPDGFSIIGLISGLADSWLVGVGHAMHSFCIKCGFDSNVHICSALVSMYSRCNCMNSAYRVFSNLVQPDLVTWSALITGFSESGEYEKALIFFRKMNVEGKKADNVLVASVVAASAQLAIVGLGKELHGYVFRLGFQSDIMVSSALIDMYSKCGLIGLGVQVFDIMPDRNIVSYNSLILGFGLHGLASEAFRTFDKLLDEGLKPDESTFSALLSACCHAGLAKEGRELFRRMTNVFGIEAKTEHFVHMVKLLGMKGELEEAYDLVLSLPEPIDSGIWGALLSCCDIHGNSELGEIVAKQLIETKPEKTAYRVMLSNIYAGNRRWDEVNKLRDSFSGGGLKKMPGLSWIGDVFKELADLHTKRHHRFKVDTISEEAAKG
ncbi:LOW QUALITY PROTEIN: E motif, partial [Dillenia turbinata]